MSASGMLPPIFGIFLDDWFLDFVFAKNKTLSISNHFLNIQWDSIFFTFSNTDQNAPIKKKSNYIALYQNPAFKTDFGPWEVPNPEKE